MKSFAEFIGPTRNAIRGRLNVEELGRTALSALGAGSVSGLAVLILKSISDHASAIFPDPSTATVATIVIGVILDLLRRINQGKSNG